MSGRMIAIIASVVIGVAVGIGIYIIGSPAEARVQRFDDRREEQLSTANMAIRDYYQQKSTLPPTLAEAKPDWVSDTTWLADPETSKPFGYRIVNDTTFELCATFSRETPGQWQVDAWSHAAGHHCFLRWAK